jgi:L-ascorbate metabolism protein UlaG (beta-lactamase superfamily)
VSLFSLEAIIGAPRYRGPKTEHFDGRKFVNVPSAPHSFMGLLRWLTGRRLGDWPAYKEFPYGEKPQARCEDLRVTVINHATVLIQMNNLNILTDPIYSDRCSPVSWSGPKRCRNPGVKIEDLPVIDIVLISHNHYDHLDLPTLFDLQRLHNPKIYTSLGNKAMLEKNGFDQVTEMDWWDELTLSKEVTLLACPGQHFSGRSLIDRDQTLWVGFVLSAGSGSVYFAGDTGYGQHFAAIGERCSNIRLALLPIGGYLPRWFMKPVHVSPDEAVTAHKDLNARNSVAIHYGTFPLSDEGATQSIADLKTALDQEAQRPNFLVLEFGEAWNIPALAESPKSR